eukprot:11182674-Lingulodinium_polyedra.AAC.1
MAALVLLVFDVYARIVELFLATQLACSVLLRRLSARERRFGKRLFSSMNVPATAAQLVSITTKYIQTVSV